MIKIEEKDLLKQLDLPKATWLQRTMPLNQILPRVSSKHRKILQNTIQAYGIRILAVIRQDNANIPPFISEDEKYEEIHLYAIELKEWNHHKEIFRTFAQIIPYPIIIYFYQGENWCILTAKYHLHQDQQALVVDQVHSSSQDIEKAKYVEKLKFSQLNKLNLKTTYENFSQSILQVDLEENYAVDVQTGINEARFQDIKAIEKQIATLKTQRNKETQMNHRVNLQIEIRKLEEEKQEILNKIS